MSHSSFFVSSFCFFWWYRLVSSPCCCLYFIQWFVILDFRCCFYIMTCCLYNHINFIVNIPTTVYCVDSYRSFNELDMNWTIKQFQLRVWADWSKWRFVCKFHIAENGFLVIFNSVYTYEYTYISRNILLRYLQFSLFSVLQYSSNFVKYTCTLAFLQTQSYFL